MSYVIENLAELALQEKCDVQIWFWGKITQKWEVVIAQQNEGIKLEIKEQSASLVAAVNVAVMRYERAKHGLGAELVQAIEGGKAESKQLPPADDGIPF